MIHSERAFLGRDRERDGRPLAQGLLDPRARRCGWDLREEPIDLAQGEPELLLHIVEGEMVVGHGCPAP